MKVVDLPEATREDQYARWSLPREYVGGGAEPVVPVAAEEMLAAGGCRVVRVRDCEADRCGLVGREPVEEVDEEVFVALLEDRLGFGVDEVRSVYRRGRLTDEQLELRSRVDARLLELADDGVNLAALGGMLGYRVRGNGSAHHAFTRALARARAALTRPDVSGTVCHNKVSQLSEGES